MVQDMLPISQRQHLAHIAISALLISFSIIGLVSTGCKSKKQEKAPDKAAIAKLNTAPVIEYALEGCLGKCPVYKAAFYSSGQLIYEGLAHVKVIGKYKYTINPQIVKDLVAQIEALKPKTLKDNYGLAPDFPVTTLTYRSGSFKKVIETAANVPVNLTEVQKSIASTVTAIITEQPGEPITE